MTIIFVASSFCIGVSLSHWLDYEDPDGKKKLIDIRLLELKLGFAIS